MALLLLTVALIWSSVSSSGIQRASADDLSMGMYVDEQIYLIVPCRLSEADLTVHKCLLVRDGFHYRVALLDDADLYI